MLTHPKIVVWGAFNFEKMPKRGSRISKMFMTRFKTPPTFRGHFSQNLSFIQLSCRYLGISYLDQNLLRNPKMKPKIQNFDPTCRNSVIFENQRLFEKKKIFKFLSLDFREYFLSQKSFLSMS